MYDMPTEYKRKGTAKRAQWTEESLIEAVRRLKAKEILFSVKKNTKKKLRKGIRWKR